MEGKLVSKPFQSSRSAVMCLSDEIFKKPEVTNAHFNGNYHPNEPKNSLRVGS